MTVYTHNGFAHLDDTIALGLILVKHPEATVIRTNKVPDNVQSDDFLVDIGMKSDGKQFFDHHQDVNLPSSFAQVLKYLYGIDIYELSDLLPELVFADLADRFGPQKANEMMNTNHQWTDALTPVITGLISKCGQISPGDFEHTLLIKIGQGLLARINSTIRAKKIILSSRQIQVPGGVVLYNPDEIINVNLASKIIPNLIGVICKNQFNPEHISIISVNNCPSFRPERVKDFLPVVFVHATGFLAVVDSKDLGSVSKIITLLSS